MGKLTGVGKSFQDGALKQKATWNCLAVMFHRLLATGKEDQLPQPRWTTASGFAARSFLASKLREVKNLASKPRQVRIQAGTGQEAI